MKTKYFNPKMGAIGAAIMGGVVYYINSEYGIEHASIAATKQAAYTFFAGGTMVGLCENLAIQIKNGKMARTAAAIIPAVTTIGLTYLIHTIKGTPEPLNSTIPTMLLSPLAFTILGNIKRNKLEKIILDQ